MASDDANITEDAEMAECEGDKVVTMMDVLQEQQEFEEDANAVLGASDDKNCTYAKGYIKRQAIYACLTCCADSKTDPSKRAGVCLACSLMCHENHELVELYTKRNFRCDCGNPKFNSHPCQFTPSKPDLNEDNIYNQNFSGLYCICHRPYPDPEATREDDMIQCIICEDWLHASHLETVVPAHDQYSEMICKSCMEKNEFLHDYSDLAVNVESGDVDILIVNGVKSTGSLCNGDVTNGNLTNNIIENNLEAAAVISNGTDVNMVESKEQIEEESSKEKESSELESNEETKQISESHDAEVTEGKSDDNISEWQKEHESQLKEAQDTCDGAKKEDNVPSESESTMENKEMSTEKEATPDQSDNTNNDSTMASEDATPDQSDNTNNDSTLASEDVEANSTTSDLVSGTQEQKEEQNEQDANAEDDTNKNKDNADSNKTDDNVDANKNDDQMLDDIQALSSVNPSDAVPKSSTEDATTLSSEKVTDDEKPESSENDKSTEQIKESTADLTTNDDSASKSVATSFSEMANTEVPDTSQPKDAEMETSQEKTDSVMDAIDELLKGPSETNKSDSKENENQLSEAMPTSKDTDNSEVPKTDEVTISDSDSKLVPDQNASSEKINTDIEMTETKRQEGPTDSKNTADSKSTKTAADNETDCTTNNEQTSETNSAEGKMETDTKASIEDTEKEINGDIENENAAISETDNKNIAEDENSNKNKSVCDESKETEESETTNEHKRKLSTEVAEETSPKKIKLDKCCRPKNIKKIFKGATFWPSNFRQKLCTCGECISMYKDLHVLFLTDPEDPVPFYEILGKENVDGGASQYEKGLQALSSLDRIQQINALTEYNKMRDKLLDFLKSFKDRKEIVKEEDIKAFFAGMKPRREPDGVYFCR